MERTDSRGQCTIELMIVAFFFAAVLCANLKYLADAEKGLFKNSQLSRKGNLP